jgi:hypothetical protein|nr:MAG TPA: hypothetical protein [Caudoviricetes sp.]
MFLGLPGFAWFVIGVIVVAVLVTVANWYIMYCVFDWAVHHVKHVWLEEPTDAIDIKESEYPKPIKREISDEEYENWEKWMDYLEDRREDA